MKDLISITEVYPSTSSIEFIINKIIYLNPNDIFLYYNNTKLNSSEYSFTYNFTKTTTNCIITPNLPFNIAGYTTLFIQNEYIFSNTIFSYFSFNTLIDSNKNAFTTLIANLPSEMINSNYRLDTFIPYKLTDLFPTPIITIINCIDPINSTITINTNSERYNEYNLILMDNSSTPLPSGNSTVKFYFEGDELLIWKH